MNNDENTDPKHRRMLKRHRINDTWYIGICCHVKVNLLTYHTYTIPPCIHSRAMMAAFMELFADGTHHNVLYIIQDSGKGPYCVKSSVQ